RALDTRNRQPNGQVLAWLIRRQRSTVLRYQVERGDIFALAHFLSQAERAKAWPCGTWVGGRPLDICANPVDLFLEVVSPVVGQYRDTHDAPQPLEIVLVAGIQPRDLRDRYGTAGSFDQEHRVSRRNLPLGSHLEIEAETAAGQKSLDDIVTTKSQPQLEAWQSRLGHHNLGRANAKPVANLKSVLLQTFDG